MVSQQWTMDDPNCFAARIAQIVNPDSKSRSLLSNSISHIFGLMNISQDARSRAIMTSTLSQYIFNLPLNFARCVTIAERGDVSHGGSASVAEEKSLANNVACDEIWLPRRWRRPFKPQQLSLLISCRQKTETPFWVMNCKEDSTIVMI